MICRRVHSRALTTGPPQRFPLPQQQLQQAFHRRLLPPKKKVSKRRQLEARMRAKIKGSARQLECVEELTAS